jgi:predicted dehydrogenase
MEMEGTSNVSLAFESGATAYHFGTWGARGSKLRYAMHAHCEGGMLELDYHSGDIRLWLEPAHGELPAAAAAPTPQEAGVEGAADKGAADEEAVGGRCAVIYHVEPGAKHNSAEMTHFLDCIEQNRQPETTLRAGLQGLRAIWRLYEAERRGVVADLRGLALDNYSAEPDPFLAETKRFGYTCRLDELRL